MKRKSIIADFSGKINYTIEEEAPIGSCSTLVNLRENSGGLTPVGSLPTLTTLAAGEKLIAAHEVHGTVNLISLAGNSIKWHATMAVDGTFSVKGITLCDIDGNLTAISALSDYVMISTSRGCVLLKYDKNNNSYKTLDKNKAIPRLLLGTASTGRISEIVPGLEFESVYTHWQPPLHADDIARLSDNIQDAYKRLQRYASGNGLLIQPLLARYAVRLWDDSYLWVSPPLLVGNGLQPAEGIATVRTEENNFIGIEQSVIESATYRVAIIVENGSDEDWDSLIKSIDILVTTESSPIDTSSFADYTCTTDNHDNMLSYRMEYSLKSASENDTTNLLLDSKKWTIACQITDMAALRQGIAKAANCDVATDATGLPAQMKRYEITHYDNTAVVESSQLSSCMESIEKNMCYNSILCHNRRLFASGNAALLVNPWHPSLFWHGNIDAGNCDIMVETYIKTPDGTAVTYWKGSSNIIPAELNPILAYPDPRAFRMKIMLLANGSVKQIEVDLSPSNGQWMAIDSSTHSFSDTGASSLPEIDDGTCIENITGKVYEYTELNPLAISLVHNVCDNSILAMAASARHTNNNIGSPIYIFAENGTYALPYLTASAKYAPAVPLTNHRIAKGTKPVESHANVYFATYDGKICSLSQYKIEDLLWHVETESLAWNHEYDELWISCKDGSIEVLMPSGRLYSRTINEITTLQQLTSDIAVAVCPDGKILDISHEDESTADVELLTNPIILNNHEPAIPYEIIWNIFASGLSMRLAAYGETGASCHGMTLAAMQVNGNVSSPIPMRLISPRTRVMRLGFAGKFPHNAIICPAKIKLKY